MDKARKIPSAIFYAAFARAKKSLFSSPILLALKPRHALAVGYNQLTGTHELHTTFSSAFIDQLQDASGLSLEDCCFLALAHESGHVELNQLCIDQGLDPADSDAQLQSISASGPKLGSKIDAQCHKESAIEAFCDAKLAASIFTHFPHNATQLLQTLAGIRQTESRKPHRFGDDYFTLPIFAEMLNSGKIIDGQSAAKLAYDASKLSMPPLENAWLSIKRPAFESLHAWRESRKAASLSARHPKP